MPDNGSPNRIEFEFTPKGMKVVGKGVVSVSELLAASEHLKQMALAVGIKFDKEEQKKE